MKLTTTLSAGILTTVVFTGFSLLMVNAVSATSNTETTTDNATAIFTDGSFADLSTQSSSDIFFLEEKQHLQLLASKEKIAEQKPQIANRDSTWSAGNFIKPNATQLKRQLTPLQFSVTQKDNTERPFKNTYWDNKEEGIYVDVISGEPLFSSKDKFKSGTGWPSFTRPINGATIIEKSDRSFFFKRTEVRSQLADSHLGHLFDDGPQPTGLRYCINSASLRFIPSTKLDSEGYEQYTTLFD